MEYFSLHLFFQKLDLFLLSLLPGVVLIPVTTPSTFSRAATLAAVPLLAAPLARECPAILRSKLQTSGIKAVNRKAAGFAVKTL